MRKIKTDICQHWLKEQIDKGKSSHDVANALDVSKSTVLRKAVDYGLKFKGKSHWRKI